MKTNWKTFFSGGHHLRIGSESESVQHMAAKVSAYLGRVVTPAAIKDAARRHNTTTPKHWVQMDSKDIPQPPEEKLQIHRIKRKHRVATQEINQLLEKLHRSELRADVALALTETSYDLSPIKVSKNLRKSKYPATAVALASDWHVEELVRPESINGRNEYNLDIADRRVDAFFRGAGRLIEHHRGSFQIDDLVLALLGDLMSGYIHEELVEDNQLSPTETILWLVERIIRGINYLLGFGIKLTVPCNYGNHGRTTTKRRISSGANNSYEWLMYKFLEQHFKGDTRVAFSVSQGDHTYVDIYDKVMRTTHGDNFNYGGGVGGLSIPLHRGVSRLESFRHADVTCMGHFHQARDFGSIVVNGSLIGYNAYALRINAPYEEAKQQFFLMLPGRGKDHVSSIWL